MAPPVARTPFRSFGRRQDSLPEPGSAQRLPHPDGGCARPLRAQKPASCRHLPVR